MAIQRQKVLIPGIYFTLFWGKIVFVDVIKLRILNEIT